MIAYLDSSAVVKLIFRWETGASELATFMRDRSGVSSELAYTEANRAVLGQSHKMSAEQAGKLRSRANTLVDLLSMVAIDRSILRFAAHLPGPHLRTLDALHVATALRLGRSVDEFVTYDRRQAAAAAGMGLAVVAPGLK